jgi:hypothetical protein
MTEYEPDWPPHLAEYDARYFPDKRDFHYARARALRKCPELAHLAPAEVAAAATINTSGPGERIAELEKENKQLRDQLSKLIHWGNLDDHP